MKQTASLSGPKRPAEEVADDAGNEQSGGDEAAPVEHGGPRGKEPTRFGDWERNGRCIDF